MSNDATPWVGKRHSYAGWVPNVHSHLSFSLIGTGRGPEVSTLTRRYEGRLCRFVCTLQRRETDDFLTPMWLTRWWRPQAIQHFLLVGSTIKVATPIGLTNVLLEAPSEGLELRRAPLWLLWLWRKRSSAQLPVGKRREVETALDDQGMLRGKIFVLPRQKSKQRRKTQDKWLKRFRMRLRSPGELDDKELDEYASLLTQDIAVSSPGSVSLEFILFRTGEVRIWLEELVADRLPESFGREISRQAYFFLKDMVHHHVHHDAKSDQITPLTAIGGAYLSQGEELWRRETAWSLSRAVDALARRGKLQDLREATGILAYADAFQKTLLLYRRRDDDASVFERNPATYRYDFAHIRESLKVQLEQVTSRRTSLSQVLIAGLAGSIAATSLLASGVSAYNSAGKSDNKLAVAPILLDVNHGVLQWWSHSFLVPALSVGTFLWLASALFLSEDRIGAKRAEHRRLAQTVRGVVNSIADRLGWNGRAVQRILEVFYIVLLIGLGIVGYLLTPHIVPVESEIVDFSYSMLSKSLHTVESLQWPRIG